VGGGDGAGAPLVDGGAGGGVESVGAGAGVEVAPVEPVGTPVALGPALVDPAGADPDGDAGAGVPDGPGDEAGVALPWAGPISRGGWTGAELGVDSSAATTPMPTSVPAAVTPTAAPRTRRSRSHSVLRRSPRSGGSVARCAARLLTGAAASPTVGNSSNPASSGPA
jgi:hypothetical protein